MIDDGVNDNLSMLVFQAMQLYEDAALVQFLYDENPVVYSAAARALQIHGTKVAFDAALELIRNAEPRLHCIGYFMLGQIGRTRPFKSESVPILLAGLDSNESFDIQCQCVAALGHLSANEASSALIRLSTHESAAMRTSVAAAIAHLVPTPPLRDVIARLRNDKDVDVQEWAEVCQETWDEASQT